MHLQLNSAHSVKAQRVAANIKLISFYVWTKGGKRFGNNSHRQRVTRPCDANVNDDERKWAVAITGASRLSERPSCFLCSFASVTIICLAFKARQQDARLLVMIGTKRGRQRQRREAIKMYLRNSLLWLHYFCWNSIVFSVSYWTERLTLDFVKVTDVLKTPWKWSSWSLIWEQDGTNVSFT